MPTLRLAKTLWGVPEADDPDLWDELFARIKAEGFDGVEAITLTWRTDRDRFVSLLKKHGLQLICQIHTSGGDLDPATGYVYCSSNKLHDHLASFVKLTAEAKALGAVLINSHSGHDSWAPATRRWPSSSTRSWSRPSSESRSCTRPTGNGCSTRPVSHRPLPSRGHSAAL